MNSKNTYLFSALVGYSGVGFNSVDDIDLMPVSDAYAGGSDIVVTQLDDKDMSVRAATTGLNDTGISTCSDANYSSLPCPVAGFPRQDAEYGTNGFNFTKLDANGNVLPATATNHVCVRDNVTGLIWEVKTDDGGLRDKDLTYTLAGATQFATAVNVTGGLCGRQDWRIPNLRELIGIVDYNNHYIAMPDYFPNTLKDKYITSHTFTLQVDGVNSTVVDYVDFSNANDFYGGVETTLAARLVRGTKTVSAFINNSNGTVTDNSTGLMWAKCNEGLSGATCATGSATLVNWGAALTAAQNSRLGSFSNWRLPNVKELQSIEDASSSYFPNNLGSFTSSWEGLGDYVIRLVRNISVTPPALPNAVTNPASAITKTSARLNGIVGSNNSATIVNFDFGPTTSYGTNIPATPASIAANALNTSVSANKTGLFCITYHYRVKAINNFGTTYGADKAFNPACTTTNLAITLDDDKGSVNAGTALTYLAKVSNQGYAANTAKIQAPAVAKLVVTGVSCGETFGGADCPANSTVAALQGTGLIIPALPTYSGLTFTINAQIAATAPSGNLVYTATVTAPVTSVFDSNNADNIAKDIDRIVSRSDFIVTAIALIPPVPMVSSTFSATVTVKNQGGVANDGEILGLWLNQPADQNCRATADKQAVVGMVAVGATKTLTFSGLTASTSGNKVLRAFVDNTCATAEINESNNQATKDYAIGGTYDLVITAIAVTPASPAANGTFNATITVKNQGTASADGGFLDVWTNKTSAATCGSDSDAWVDVGILSAGATKTVTATGLTAGTAGTKTLRALVDSWCEIAETNELNNQLTKVYTVR